MRRAMLVTLVAWTLGMLGDAAGSRAWAVAPVLGNLGDITSKPWNSPVFVIDADATVTDADSPALTGGVLTAKLVAVGGSTVTVNDFMTILGEGTGAGLINTVGTDVRSGATSIGTWNGATVSGAGVLRVTLKNTATPAIVTKLLRRIAYRNGSTSQLVATKTVQFQLTDAPSGGTSAAVNKVIRLMALPILGNLTDVTARVWNSSVFLIDSDATVTDADSPNFDTGILTAKLVAVGASTVNATDLMTILSEGTGAGQINISGTDVRSGTTSIGTWNGVTVSGATVLKVTLKSTATPAIVQKLLRRIAYRNSSSTKNTGERTVQFQISDGDGTSSAPVNKKILLGTFDGTYTGTFVGSYTAFGFTDTIPGVAIEPGDNTIQTVINNGQGTITLPGIGGSGTGVTVNSGGGFGATSSGNISGFGINVKFTGSLVLQPNNTVTGSGTWTILPNPDGITGSGTWNVFRP